ncbi:3'-5' exoribonuclease YhaM family protein [Bulleidia sp. HCP3S3_F2]|mgnify:FL=1|jgi:3'-5' exoribonuclease|uniref:3'-5' exoribonuclease YhaM family protein n=1 Tax=unclassified Bulleidia TaxID=2704656 RepID=UPI002A8DC599|nr:HD domain-containing protein [Erysipelotrichaceae bacterium 7770_A6]MCI7725166.1 HD domain-containing protein [Erysipelotrichaceae bacterium]MDD7057966.1 HD domain-containing protein [Erysipelotrichaceae bacterium]MDY3659610.1 HD domain-containing protein [Bulleidia sp.]
MVKINEFEEHMKLQQPLLVKDVKNGTTSKGSPYLSLTLQDKTGTIDGKFWDVKENEQALIQAGKILKFSFEVLLYKDKLQLRMNHVEEISEDEYNLEDFVISSDHSEVERRSLTQSLIDSIQNDVYRKLVIGMLSYVGDKFFTFPAASKIHHGWKGGLSDHSLSMAILADELCKHYPQLDRDLLVSAALIHDVGKTAELSGPVTTEYTLEGKLEGHISLANAWLSEVSEKLGVQEREETVLMHHMILSHHGKMEYGSPVAPMIIEAEALYLIDNMDARLTSLKMALDAIKPGTWTSRMFQFENRQFYKHK